MADGLTVAAPRFKDAGNDHLVEGPEGPRTVTAADAYYAADLRDAVSRLARWVVLADEAGAFTGCALPHGAARDLEFAEMVKGQSLGNA